MTPKSTIAAITPNDTTDLQNAFGRYPTEIHVGSGGNLSVVDQAGTTVTILGVQAGAVLRISPKIIRSTATTAGSIAAFYTSEAERSGRF